MKLIFSSLHNFKFKGFAKTFSISFLNQLVGSGSNFLLGLYLVRVLSPEQFGIYGIGFAIVLLFSGFGNALFITQMVVLLPDKLNEYRKVYANRMLALLLIFCLLSAMLMISLFFILGFLLPEENQFLSLSLAILVAAIANILKEFCIRYAFSFKNEINALAVNITWSLFGLLFFSLTVLTQYELTASNALLIYGIANFFSFIVGFFINKFSLRSTLNKHLIVDFKEAFRGGKWATGGVTVTWLQSQAYIYVCAILFGPIGVALANAAKVFTSPFTFIVPAVNSIVLPKLAELRNSNQKRMLQFTLTTTFVLLVLGVIYLSLLFISIDWIIPLMIGDQYSLNELKPFIVLWGGVLLLQLTRNGASILLQALKLFKSITINNLFSAFIAISCSYFLAVNLGSFGAVGGVAIGELMLAAVLWFKVIKSR